LTPCVQDLRAFNTFGLASQAHAFVTLSTVSQLNALSELATHYSRVLVLGGGSNMVLPERVEGLIIKVALPGMRLLEDGPTARIIEVGAGEPWHGVVASCVTNGWPGLENLSLIPGTAGAAPVQNIGAYGVELADRFHSLSAWNFQTRQMVEMSAADCRFAYRDSVFKQAPPGRWLIVAVRLALPKPWTPMLDYPDLQRVFAPTSTSPQAQDIFRAVCDIRRTKLPDPAVTGNAGSFFKNPLVDAKTRDALCARFPGLVSYLQAGGRYKLAAGWLIDQCGWKGRQLGAAAVHDRQALVLVNRGGAKAGDIMALARAIQNDVAQKYGVALEPEPLVL
jgi:UDP-N-acetylmuramate dehydrogenase